MSADEGSVICSFCGEPGSRERALACSLGATICVPCLDRLHELGSGLERTDPHVAPDGITDEELLARLPVILASGRQMTDFAQASVAELRERQVTWTEIGGVLGVSRQAAWERYSKRDAPTG